MIRSVKKVIEVLERIDQHLHIIARALEADALATNAYATDKQLHTKPKLHVRNTIGGTTTGSLKDDAPQCELDDFA